MRIITHKIQLHRVAGLELPLNDARHYPVYPYENPIPKEVGEHLLMSLEDVELPIGRDFLNDDGGYIVILDHPSELYSHPFGLPNVDTVESVHVISTDTGQTWLHCLWIYNNETGVSFAFDSRILPPLVFVDFLSRVEE